MPKDAHLYAAALIGAYCVQMDRFTAAHLTHWPAWVYKMYDAVSMASESEITMYSLEKVKKWYRLLFVEGFLIVFSDLFFCICLLWNLEYQLSCLSFYRSC